MWLLYRGCCCCWSPAKRDKGTRHYCWSTPRISSQVTTVPLGSLTRGLPLRRLPSNSTCSTLDGTSVPPPPCCCCCCCCPRKKRDSKPLLLLSLLGETAERVLALTLYIYIHNIQNHHLLDARAHRQTREHSTL